MMEEALAGQAPAQEAPTGASAATPDRSPPDAERTPTLSLEGITKRWGERTVLDHAGLSLDAGASAWISGENGVGKTTLLRIIAGLISADQGTVSLNGVDLDEDRRAYQRQVGFLTGGDSGLYARLSIRHNLEFWAGVAFVPRSRRRETVDRALARFSIEGLASRRADRLSLGQRQRVRLALTFLHDPELVLLDEPSTSLDDEGLSLLAAALTEHARRGGNVVCCAPTRHHELSLDRAYVLKGGTLQPA
ncbi:MAG: heme ABC exporter ATP-binding protein CcmA [Actinomycetota bacterium]|nr:heme ABC exporter ATP-binding protein CcmA [Actinomycetota bacterium]